MAEFTYKGRSNRGELVSGRLHGDSPDTVANRLFGNGVTPLEIVAVTERGSTDVDELWRRMGGGKPRTKDMILLCRQMYTITKSGLPLLRGLNGLVETTHNVVLRNALNDVVGSLEAGRGLAKSFERHPDIFSELFVSLVEIGEATGTLEEAFDRIGEHLRMDQEIRDRVKAAVRYPIIVIIAAAIALTIITVFVIPNFAPIFRALGDAIPLPTKIILGVSNFAVNNGPLLLAAIALSTIASSAYVRTEKGRWHWDRLKLQIPVTGTIVRNAVLSRITRSLAVALKAGLPINQTLSTIMSATGNVFLSEKLANLREGIERGESLASTAADAALFTPLILQMIALGEETGQLSELMEDAADYYKREVDYDLETLSAALEPILIVVVGVIVLVLALGVFLPMWDMIGRTRGG